MSLGILGVCDICLNSIYFIPDYFFCSFIWVQISGHDQSCFVLLKFFLFEENCKVTKIWKIHHCAALFWGSLLNIVSLYVSMMREFHRWQRLNIGWKTILIWVKNKTTKNINDIGNSCVCGCVCVYASVMCIGGGSYQSMYLYNM